ncbi:NAD(P)-binding protein [Mycena floridula]|nr:NAD(P)-binding protein [Mycena floridula]
MSTSSTSRVWFITGTSSGLGLALTKALLSSGERVVATCRKPAAHSELSSQYPSSQLLVKAMDLTDTSDVAHAFSKAVEAFGRIDVVVNNAGYALIGEIEGIPEEEARKQFDVQFWGAVNVTKQAARVFREVNPKGSGGRLFNISSIGGYMANPTLAYYSASKFALEAFTESFIKEMQPDWNIKGCIIEPGGFDSEWRGSSAQTLPPHPAYTEPQNPCAKFRKIHDSSDMPLLGSSHRMALAIIRLAGEPELPLRVQFGSEALFLVGTQAQKTISEGQKWAELSHSTNREDMDGEKYVKEILLGTGNFERNRT